MKFKNLKQFEKFDLDEFLKRKRLMVTGFSDWEDYDTHKHLGTLVEVTIIDDKTEYVDENGNKLNGVTNRFEKFSLKIPKEIDIPLDSIVVPVNAVAKVYAAKGTTFRNQLTVKCDDLKIVPTTTKGV